MARLSGTILSDDESFKAQLATMLRTSSVPVIVGDDRRGASPDVAVVDGRGDLAAAVALVERLRTADATTGIFFVAVELEPRRDSAVDARRRQRVLHLAAGQGRARRRHHAHRGHAAATSAPPQATTMVFFGAKGGAGTMMMAVNCAVEPGAPEQRSRPWSC